MSSQERQEAPTYADARLRASAGEWVAIGSLVPWSGNPRRNEAAIAKVAASIQRFGFGAPILAREANREIIAGHTRFEAARQLGLERVPVRFLALDERQARLLALAEIAVLKQKELPVEECEASIRREFELPWPGGRTVARGDAAVAAWRAASGRS